jgi:hypothetical protein
MSKLCLKTRIPSSEEILREAEVRWPAHFSSNAQ